MKYIKPKILSLGVGVRVEPCVGGNWQCGGDCKMGSGEMNAF